MRLAVRMAIETRNSIEILKNELKESGNFDNLRITNGFIVNMAYIDSKLITKNSKWSKVVSLASQIDERKSPKTRTDLQVNQTTIDGIIALKQILPQYTNTNYVTTSFVIKMIIMGSLLIRQNKI